MTALTIAHTSDLHIDDTEVKGPLNGLAGLRLVLATAQAAHADLLLLAGDTFDNHRVSRATLDETGAILAAAPMPVAILPGNHDPAMDPCLFQRAGLAALEHIHILGVTTETSILLPHLALEIWGHAHRNYDDMAPLRAPRPRTTQWQIAMAHGHYVPPEDADQAGKRAWQITDPELLATHADYIALGHWDRAATVGPGTIPAAYSGSPELARTVNLVRLDPANGVSFHREKLHGL